MRRAALRSIQTVGSKSFSSQAKCTGKSLSSKSVIVGRAGLSGEEAAQDDSMSLPSGSPSRAR